MLGGVSNNGNSRFNNCYTFCDSGLMWIMNSTKLMLSRQQNQQLLKRKSLRNRPFVTQWKLKVFVNIIIVDIFISLN